MRWISLHFLLSLCLASTPKRDLTGEASNPTTQMNSLKVSGQQDGTVQETDGSTMNKKMSPERLADILDKLQAPQNNGRGVSCIRSMITWLRRGDYRSARAVSSNEYDKIRGYPDIQLVIDHEFGDYIYKAETLRFTRCNECGKLSIVSDWLDRDETSFFCNYCVARGRNATDIPREEFEKEFWEFVEEVERQ